MFVLSGEAFLIGANGEERRFGPGRLGFFPAGTKVTWRVPAGVKKFAVVREGLWAPLGFALKAWNKVVRAIFGGKGSRL